jgi:quercetin dioxygenase-like cupin family protein
MHRTLSLDYCVVMKGELVCVFDSGEETVLREGEVMLQRGTNHQWENRMGEWSRVLFVMLGAEKVVLERGEVQEQTVIRKPVN